MSLDWPEVDLVIKENRHEIVLHGGNKKKERVFDEQIQELLLHKDSQLNYVEIVSLGLRSLDSSIGNVCHLTNLVLRSNSLESLPDEIGQLESLKLLDCSNNSLATLSSSMSKLKNLSTLNLMNNKLTSASLFDFSNLLHLQHLNLSNNTIDSLSDSLFQQGSKLQELFVDHNQVSSLPPTMALIANILKTFSIASNNLIELPYLLKDFSKLKVLNLKDNKFADKRFGKLVADPRQSSSAIVDYLRKKAPKADSNRENENEETELNDDDALGKLIIKVGVSPSVKRCEEIVKIRPNIVCCIIRNLDLNADNIKKLISIHNKFHDSICDHRSLASIGFHDMAKFKFPISYMALEPEKLKIVPLGKTSIVSAKSLIEDLTAEAEALRKKQKKNTYSSAHKYLHFVEGLELYPCLVDANDVVLSFAPVTNSENTKIDVDTKDVFIEVTSQDKMPLCREIMNKFVQEILSKSMGKISIEQVKVVHENGNLISAYPDKSDLALDDWKVERLHAT